MDASCAGVPGETRGRFDADAVLVTEQELSPAFQPIVSVRTGHCWGVEAYARAPRTTPLELFARAQADGVLESLDRFCRRRAVEDFVADATTPDVLLSLNWDARAMHDADRAVASLLAILEHAALPPERVVLEVRETGLESLESLRRFTQARKAEGFLVAVDDYGTGHTSAERLVELEPDVVKLDGSLTRGVRASMARRESCRSMTELGRSIGAVVVAEGVEEEEDLVELAMIGIDLFQGYVIARPSQAITSTVRNATRAVERCRPLLRVCAERELAARRHQRKEHEGVLVGVAGRIAHATRPTLDEVSASVLASYSALEAVYVLDELGVQLTATHLRPGLDAKRGFRSTAVGSDLGLKDYFLEVSHGAVSFATRPYVSMASGRPCVTHSRRVRLADGRTVVVCCDLPTSTPALAPSAL